MHLDLFAARVRARELYREARLPGVQRAILRVDGRGSSRLTEARFQKPFDPRFHEAMRAVGRALLLELQGAYVHVASDEASLLLPRATPYGGRHEKLVSLAAGIASAAFTAASGVIGAFDARAWVGSDDAVLDYFRWRQADGQRCALGTLCYWTLRNAGVTPRAASDRLEGASFEAQRALLRDHGVDPDALPAWQVHGVGLRFVSQAREGHDPRSGEVALVTRRRIEVDERLPVGEAYASYLTGL